MLVRVILALVTSIFFVSSLHAQEKSRGEDPVWVQIQMWGGYAYRKADVTVYKSGKVEFAGKWDGVEGDTRAHLSEADVDELRQLLVSSAFSGTSSFKGQEDACSDCHYYRIKVHHPSGPVTREVHSVFPNSRPSKHVQIVFDVLRVVTMALTRSNYGDL